MIRKGKPPRVKFEPSTFRPTWRFLMLPGVRKVWFILQEQRQCMRSWRCYPWDPQDRQIRKASPFRGPRYTSRAKSNSPTLSSQTYLGERPLLSWAVTSNPADRHRRPTRVTRKPHMLSRQDTTEVRHPRMREGGGSWARPWPWSMVQRLGEAPREGRILHGCPLASAQPGLTTDSTSRLYLLTREGTAA